MKIESLDLARLEDLWREFTGKRAKNPKYTVQEYAKSNQIDLAELEDLFGALGDLKLFTQFGPEMPQRIGEYEVLRVVGVGASSSVYEARLPRVEQRFALKVVPPVSEVSRKRFEREIDVISSLRHANIVPLVDEGCTQDTRYIAMKLINGPSLACILHQEEGISDAELAADELQAKKLGQQLTENWSLQLRVLLEIAEAMCYAHKKGVLHRDLKPGNVILDEELKAWVTDFGLAKYKHIGDSESKESRVVGTPRYMAPEQIRGEADEKSDVFGLGMIAYELAILQEGVVPERQRIWRGGLRSPREHNPRMPRGLERFVLKATHPDPKQRISSMRQAEEFLRTLLTQEDLDSKPRDFESNELPSFGKNLILLAFCVLAILAALAALPLLNKAESNPSILSERSSSDSQGSSLPLSTERNAPPSLDSRMFVEPGVIQIDRHLMSQPVALQYQDENCGIFNGIYARIVGGRDQEKLLMTPEGIVFALNDDSSDDSRYEIEIEIQDDSYMQSAELLHREDSFELIIKRLIGPGDFRETARQSFPSVGQVRALATRDGKTFYFLAEAEDSLRLGSYELATKDVSWLASASSLHNPIGLSLVANNQFRVASTIQITNDGVLRPAAGLFDCSIENGSLLCELVAREFRLPVDSVDFDFIHHGCYFMFGRERSGYLFQTSTKTHFLPSSYAIDEDSIAHTVWISVGQDAQRSRESVVVAFE